MTRFTSLCLMIMMATLALACGSGGNTADNVSSDSYDAYDNPPEYDHGDQDVVPDTKDVTPDSQETTPDIDTGGDVTKDDSKTDTFIPNLDDFMWIEGSWLCTDGNCVALDYNPLKVTVTGWDADKGGAMIDGFMPCSNGIVYFDGVDFTFDGSSKTGSVLCTNGIFNFDAGILSFDEYLPDNPDVKAPWIYKLQ